MKRYITLVFVLAIFGCGELADYFDSDKDSDPIQQATIETPDSSLSIVKTSENIPECNTINETKIIYVQDEAVFKYC